jgi:hypothetical protein
VERESRFTLTVSTGSWASYSSTPLYWCRVHRCGRHQRRRRTEVPGLAGHPAALGLSHLFHPCPGRDPEAHPRIVTFTAGCTISCLSVESVSCSEPRRSGTRICTSPPRVNLYDRAAPAQ